MASIVLLPAPNDSTLLAIVRIIIDIISPANGVNIQLRVTHRSKPLLISNPDTVSANESKPNCPCCKDQPCLSKAMQMKLRRCDMLETSLTIRSHQPRADGMEHGGVH